MVIEPDLTLKQVAQLMNLSPDAVEDMADRGEGPPRYRASPKRWRYPAHLFRAWREKQIKAAQAEMKSDAA